MPSCGDLLGSLRSKDSFRWLWLCSISHRPTWSARVETDSPFWQCPLWRFFLPSRLAHSLAFSLPLLGLPRFPHSLLLQALPNSLAAQLSWCKSNQSTGLCPRSGGGTMPLCSSLPLAFCLKARTTWLSEGSSCLCLGSRLEWALPFCRH